jgi:hypothetical protein
MEKIEEHEITEIQITHEFYCDDCGKFLLKSNEYEDGYYDKPDKYYIQHVKLKGHYCAECGTKRVNKVIEFARENGFDIQDD